MGGSPHARWAKGADLYDRVVHRARIACRNGRLRGMLWHQGESDSQEIETARAYGDRLACMVMDLRVDLEAARLPFLAGLLGEFLFPATMNDLLLRTWSTQAFVICLRPFLSQRLLMLSGWDMREMNCTSMPDLPANSAAATPLP